ncbi:hypothetical protein [Sphingosinicella terrae]|uniref:hypothetical protein n=1 Tax=Sphingosinicella terrae TaxID=2172047 RepID=UPI0025465BB5|nr:hypothetical protein [Sphingosinicella terrae]
MLERIGNIDSEGAMEIRQRIEIYLRQSGMKPARFGREVLNDPGLVFDLRNGRVLRARTRQRLIDWLDARPGTAK